MFDYIVWLYNFVTYFKITSKSCSRFLDIKLSAASPDFWTSTQHAWKITRWDHQFLWRHLGWLNSESSSHHGCSKLTLFALVQYHVISYNHLVLPGQFSLSVGEVPISLFNPSLFCSFLGQGKVGQLILGPHYLQLGQLDPQGFSDVGALRAHSCLQGLLAGLRRRRFQGVGWSGRIYGRNMENPFFEKIMVPCNLTDGMGMGWGAGMVHASVKFMPCSLSVLRLSNPFLLFVAEVQTFSGLPWGTPPIHLWAPEKM